MPISSRLGSWNDLERLSALKVLSILVELDYSGSFFHALRYYEIKDCMVVLSLYLCSDSDNIAQQACKSMGYFLSYQQCKPDLCSPSQWDEYGYGRTARYYEIRNDIVFHKWLDALVKLSQRDCIISNKLQTTSEYYGKLSIKLDTKLKAQKDDFCRIECTTWTRRADGWQRRKKTTVCIEEQLQITIACCNGKTRIRNDEDEVTDLSYVYQDILQKHIFWYLFSIRCLAVNLPLWLQPIHQ